MNGVTDDIRWQLDRALQEALTDEVLKSLESKVRDIVGEAAYEFSDRIQSDLSYNLAAWTQRMFEHAVEAMLNGDDEEMRKHLWCKEGSYNGRNERFPAIHGKLFESNAEKMRRSIVDAHSDLLKNERILDLENHVERLLEQIRYLEKNEERLRNGH